MSSASISNSALVFRYSIFAAVATALNLSAQIATFAVFHGDGALFLALVIGSGVGIITKYLLDKKWIFYDEELRILQNGLQFFKYSLMGVFTTAIFWVTEISFDAIFQTDAMRYFGAVLGLIIGYFTKFRLDSQYVFNRQKDAL